MSVKQQFTRGGAQHACRACGTSVTSRHDLCGQCRQTHITTRNARTAERHRQRYVKHPETVAGLNRLNQRLEIPTKS
jgi:hypothetical protein